MQDDDIVKIGITGTRFGWTPNQRMTFEKCLPNAQFEFHHGVCVGVDCQSHNTVRRLCPTAVIVLHPSVDKRLQGCVDGDLTWKAKTHFARNRDIVDSTDLLIVVPNQNAWQDHGGTWYTFDYAIKQNKIPFIIWPNGKLQAHDRTNRPLNSCV